MKITIEAEPKEIAAFLLEIEKQPVETIVHTIDVRLNKAINPALNQSQSCDEVHWDYLSLQQLIKDSIEKYVAEAQLSSHQAVAHRK